MHNVLLRNAKHFMVLWKDNKTITEIHFSSIQCVVDKFVTPVTNVVSVVRYDYAM